MDQQAKIQTIIDHVAKCQKLGLCTQCTHPWYDGICECENYNEQGQGKVADLAHDLIQANVNIDGLL